jgi:D-glycero-D-manno-heptose 1,7-bisphosphate phosphatase
MTTPALVLLDRDGVLNELWHEPDLGQVDTPANPSQLRLTPSAAAGVRLLNAAGVPCVVASNQPGVAKGKLSHDMLRQVTAALTAALATGGARLDHVYYCVHHPQATVAPLRADCPNRKPRPGLLLRACRRYGVAPQDCWFIGDTAIDVAAGTAAGCRTAWIGTLRCDLCPARSGVQPTLIAPDLVTAVAAVLNGVSDAVVSR